MFRLLEEYGMSNEQNGYFRYRFQTFSCCSFQFRERFLADKYDAKKIIVISIGGITLNALLYPLYVHGFTTYTLFQVINMFIIMAYFPCLIKYVNNLNGDQNAGNSFGIYYLINGISGAIGNFIPLWISQKLIEKNPVSAAVFSMGIITLIATILVILFIDSEKKLAERGIRLKGDEPIKIRHIPYVIKWPGTWVLFFAYGLHLTLYDNISFMNPYLVEGFDVSVGLSSGLQVVRQYLTMLVAPVGGFMADRVFKATYKWFICAFIIIGVLFAGLCLFPVGANSVAVGLYTVLPAAATMALYAVTWSIMRETHVPAMVHGTAVGIATLSGRIFPMFLSPMYGRFIDDYGVVGYKLIFVSFIVVCALGICNALYAGSLNKKCLAGKKMNLGKLEKTEA